jgi:hypothetical protein
MWQSAPTCQRTKLAWGCSSGSHSPSPVRLRYGPAHIPNAVPNADAGLGEAPSASSTPSGPWGLRSLQLGRVAGAVGLTMVAGAALGAGRAWANMSMAPAAPSAVVCVCTPSLTTACKSTAAPIAKVAAPKKPKIDWEEVRYKAHYRLLQVGGMR